MLQSHAFGSGSLFTTELSHETDRWLDETAADYWRNIFYKTEPSAAAALYNEGIRPSSFAAVIKKRGIGPVTIKPQPEKIDSDALNRAFETLTEKFSAARNIWLKKSGDIKSLYGTSIRGNSFRSDIMPSRIKALEQYLSDGRPDNKFDHFKYFSAEFILEKRGDEAPIHSFFEAVDRLITARDNYKAELTSFRTNIIVNSIEYSEKALAEKMRVMDIRDFNSLITDAAVALTSPSGHGLADAVRKEYSAALIDEFQDTDPVQYTIFSRIFDHPGSLLFLIGDPKQAIYGFRDADIFSYIKASNRAENRYTLKTNYRSRSGLVSSINSLFSKPRNPFLFNEIVFEAVETPVQQKENIFTINGTEPANMNICLIEPDPSDKNDTVTVGSASHSAEIWTAAEISRLLNAGIKKKAMIGDRPLMPGDIAVLVRKNKQAQKIKERLREYSIPSVIYSAGSVFSSEAAYDTALIMRGIADCRDLRLMKAALATRVFGFTSADITGLNTDDRSRENILAAFLEYRERWIISGYMTMLHILLAKEAARGRLLSSIDGERYLTDLLHIAELLHTAENHGGLGIEALIDHLLEKSGESGSSDEHQLRLESDENAVKIVTVHKSKGLEYNLVFCPYLWDISDPKDPYPFKYHDPVSGETIFTVSACDDNDEDRQIRKREDLAENMRLMYVALTRAKYACWFTWGKINKKLGSAPAMIFHSGDDPVESPQVLADRVTALSWDKMKSEITDAAEQAGARVITVSDDPGISYFPRASSKQDAACRKYTGPSIAPWIVASYSRITSTREASGENEPAAVTAPAVLSDEKNRFTFPAGTEAGSCIHSIFEKADYSFKAVGDVDALILTSLREYGFDPEWKDAAADIFASTVKASLTAPDGSTFSLAETSRDTRLNEMQFYFPCASVSAAGLASVFSSAPSAGGLAAAMTSLGFSMKSGYLTGFIDLIIRHKNFYYIIDWKSNRLGYDFTDYSQERLKAAMEHSLYDLQYHIYVMALNRYLEKMDPDYSYEKNFGGAVYPFVRGTSPGETGGIYRDIPDRRLISALDRYFMEGDTK
jgi:exodeoxyribonuclease V beta subunit